MEENNPQPEDQSTSTKEESVFGKYHIIIKSVIIFILLLVFIIPQVIINGLISERENNQAQAFYDISNKWSGRQTITGPILSIPYLEYYRDTNKVMRSVKHHLYILPDMVNINGNVLPEKRHRNIYEVVVYNSKINVKASFDKLNLNSLSIPKENFIWKEASIVLGLSDMRGIKEKLEMTFNNEVKQFNPGVVARDIFESGAIAPLEIDSVDNFLASGHELNLSIDLKGSEQLFFVPVGKTTEVKLVSKWQTPAFNGQFLPDTSQIDANGFTANWKILHLNRNYPQMFIDDAYNISYSSFGVDLIMPIDGYQKTSRSVKYAMMIILLTFLVFFLVEITQQKKIHPFNYIIVGFALCLFYTLLLSFSEYMIFSVAYLIATVMTVGAISYFIYFLFKGTRVFAAIGGMLTLLYGFMFVIIQLESYALLIGSLGLFTIMFAIMNYTRKIDWYNLGKKK
ncbi:MAG: cell envelope integrity protein CreD [Sphingobacteriaceae bacterium]|jgi:inner membrane protein